MTLLRPSAGVEVILSFEMTLIPLSSLSDSLPLATDVNMPDDGYGGRCPLHLAAAEGREVAIKVCGQMALLN